MNQKYIAIIAVVIVAIAGISAAFILTDDGDNNKKGPSGTTTIKDAVDRDVTVPDNLDDGIVTVGWNILKVLSFFEAHDKVTCVDAHETMMAYGSLQPHYYCYDMKTMGTHTDSTLGGFTEKDVEDIANEKHSLVIMTSNIYSKYKTSSDVLAAKYPLVVIDLSAMSGDFWEEKDGKLVVESKIQNSIRILGKILKEESRSETVIKTLNDTLDDIVSNKNVTSAKKVNLSGSEMAMGPGDLNYVFPFFNPLNIANVTNAAMVFPMPPFARELTVEDFTTSYAFDVILYDPSNPSALANENDQNVLRWLYEKQGDAEEKEIYVVLTTALCGYDMMNVIADAYFVEATIGETITMEQMKTKMTALYKTLFGDSVGGSLWDDLAKTMKERGAAYGVCTDLWQPVKVGIVDGVYTFVAASS